MARPGKAVWVTPDTRAARRERLLVRCGLGIMVTAIVLGAFVFGTTDSRVFVGPPLLAGGLLYALGLRVVPRPERRSRLRRDGALVLPRRVPYGASMGASLLLISLGLLSMGAIGIGDGHYSGPSRFGDAALGLVLVSIPVFAAGLLISLGTALGRGRLRLTPSYVEMVPLVGRSKRVVWDELVSADLVDDGQTLLVLGAGERVVVPLNGQRWQGALIQRILRQYAIESDAERKRMTDPDILGRWRVGPG